ncbi:MAG: MBL fold metallo-hydrolase [Candidatus Cloacimonetes bacterium]|nr:MBL fold metallo-hydrolase [Candidatus Cloacimonadota bacterium]MCF7814875.1 MBL fold metallo-hydrolase [Candidatus Cloacimonadota bacterium]MCF7868150.1 MBL fold metallo-hydrolase [Candidatus Cloacimonadota bacterium]MCF7884576.1 MBL fold metallo-hydrolase [Candidatus Cloacimonadota bacterium]
MINIKWFGHSMWKIWNDKVSVITDPFTDIGYPLPKNETADIVLSSHDHFDHNNFDLITGNFQKINNEGKYNISGVEIKTIPTWHDEEKGGKRGKNLLMKFTLDRKTFLHCGDLGHDLNDEMISKLGKIDVLFIPVGGHFTIDAVQAKKIVDKIKPKIVFPMHYKTEVLDFPIAKKEAYLDLIPSCRKVDSNILKLEADDFQTKQTIILDFK